MDGRTDGRAEAPGDSRERLVEFAFDYCYWSVNPEASNYASQEEQFRGGFGGVFWIIVLLQNPSSLQFEVTYLPIYQSGKGYKAISKALGLPRTTVRAIIYKWRKHGTVENLPRSGRPTKITPRAQRQLIQEVTKVPTTTSKELQASLTSVKVFQDLGMCVLAGAAEGYNVCLFAYGQTGSGKTYTMMGNPDSLGLTPRICQGLFRSGVDSPDGQTCRVEVSFLEIYNERVRDLLRGADQKKPVALRVREHPEKGPYVQGLTQHVVEDYKQAADLLEAGIANRITAATHVHDASSRSHAIFSIQYTQAILENNLPSEVVSKINLVDLAGSERADPNYCRDRITEGANINKSLVTLGIVISALAQNSQMCSSSQSINSMLSEGEVSMVGSQSSSLSSSSRRHCFIPYRDSVLTWLLKDSLGGNSKTIMIATISPSCSGYSETLSTLRYAAHAKNIVNKPRVNEDASVRLIRELREEIDRLKSMLLSFSLQRNPSPSLSDERDSSLSDIVLQNELKVEQLTKDWSESWRDKRALLEQYSVDINQDKSGVQIHSLRPHLMSLEPDILSTGVTIYHLQEGITRIGPQGPNEEEPHIVMPEGSVCEIENQNGVVILKPRAHTACMVNNREVTEPCRLAQGAVITLAGRHKFRFNHPAEAAALRERRRIIEGGSLFSSSELNALMPNSRPDEVGSQEASDRLAPWQRLEEHQRYVECLREEILVEQRRAEKDLEREQAHLRKQHSEIQQWILQEKQRLAAIREKGTLDSGVQTDIIPLPALAGINENESSRETVRPSLVVDDRKRVVQEELLKHHALRRNENRIRRKRLRYQLERIARKRHLLEAKQELQRLETALSLGVDSPQSPDLGSPSKRRERPLVLRRHSFSVDLLSRLYPQHTPIFRSGGKSSPHEGNKGLESIRKALSRSVGFGIKMALSRVFRKPPLGSRGGKSAKSVSRVKTQFAVEGKKDKNVGDMVTKQSHSPIKSAVSCNGLDQLISLKEKKQGRWHSAEALTKKTRRWVKMQQDLTNWVENNGNEAPDDSSDCDSLFSVDSLSSAYAIALAEQLQQEDCEPSEAESEDSQMSKDSLVKEHSGTTDPKAALNLSHSICHTFLSSPNPQSTTGRERIESKEMPEEFFRSQKGKDATVKERSHTNLAASIYKIEERNPLMECKANHRSSMQEYKRRVYKEMSCWSDLSKDTFQYQEEDSVSLAQSDCNTDALVSINPLAETSPPQEDYQIPENLPMHNKFTNWSGISQQPPARLANQNNSAVEKSPDINTHNLQLHSAESESLGCRYKPDLLESADRRAREIERLRMEREQVLASMQLDLSPHPLSVELTEAKLHYGLGKTDTLLKMLKSSSKTESTISTKQQLYDRHRRSIDGLRKEREDRLQMSRRARSLSPSKHPNSTTNITEQSQRAVALPSRHREYLQQLRKEVVEMSRVPDPPRREGQYPTDIELLLRDYSRAREEAKTEIARARVRLRERTEQEKRRLEQQALSQSVKDHLRLCTRVSSSTLCTGSNLSLSSGPTSGYNSSNAALLKDGTSPSIQVTGVSDRELRVRSRPPMIPLQSLQAPRSWLSAQDIRLESSSSGYELHSSSSPSTPSGRQRTCSFSSPSSISIPYQDIADCTLTSAISEFHLASGGDVRNLLAGNAEAGWRHQGLENGVQTFYRPSSRPSSYGFLGVMELEKPLASLWSLIRDHSKTHLYNKSLKSMWTRLLDDTTQLVYLLTDPSNCHMKQPRDFCCLSAESKQDDMWVLAMQSVFEESLPRPSVDTVRGEMFPSAWILQRSQRQGREVVTVIYLLQVDLGTPTLPQRLVNEVARKQAAVIADLDSFLSL
ncbi:hypothetical protein QTP86_021155 [Hemibagrus guttatus]|nr:hypothetical protein QTP86_021155 [Hemibagrus guttatus]